MVQIPTCSESFVKCPSFTDELSLWDITKERSMDLNLWLVQMFRNVLKTMFIRKLDNPMRFEHPSVKFAHQRENREVCHYQPLLC